MKRLVLASLLVATQTGCLRCDDATSAGSGRLGAQTSGSLTLRAEQRASLQMSAERPVFTLAGGGGRLSLNAIATSGYLAHVLLELPINSHRPGPFQGRPDTAVCKVRYIDDGRLTQIDYYATSVSGRILEHTSTGTKMELNVSCRKVFSQDVGGEPVAPSLPGEIRLAGEIVASPPVVQP